MDLRRCHTVLPSTDFATDSQKIVARGIGLKIEVSFVWDDPAFTIRADWESGLVLKHLYRKSNRLEILFRKIWIEITRIPCRAAIASLDWSAIPARRNSLVGRLQRCGNIAPRNFAGFANSP